jgi:hypothetical protein
MLLTFDNAHQTSSFSNFDQKFCKFGNSNFNLKFSRHSLVSINALFKISLHVQIHRPI